MERSHTVDEKYNECVQVSAPGKYLKLLVEAIDWQAESVSHNRGSRKALGFFVRLVDSISTQTSSQQPPTFRVDIAEEDLEIVTGALEDCYHHGRGTLFEDNDSLVDLIQIFWDAEDRCLVAAGRKPPVREALDSPHIGQRLG